jgi:uncharacterized delta-60 repeat protein
MLRPIRIVICLAAGLALALGVPLAAWAASGDLDATFGTGGKVTTDFAGGTDEAHGVVIQPLDGKIVAAGEAKTSYGEDFALARYSPNGTLDTTFGTGGLVTTDFNGRDDVAFAVALQSDGKIVAAGQAQSSYGQAFALARYNPDGTLDATFGRGGKVTTAFTGRDDAAHGVVRPVAPRLGHVAGTP